MAEATGFTTNLAEAAHLVEPVVLAPLAFSDPDDDPVLYTAADGGADILCTRNTRHFSTPTVRAFCEKRGIRVMTDIEILRELFAGSSAPGPCFYRVAETPSAHGIR